MKVFVKKLDNDAKLPVYQHEGDSCADICSIESAVVLSGKRQLVGTGLSLSLPLGYECQVRPRSGLAAKYGITVLNTPGTIDQQYTGEIKIVLYNTSDQDFVINKGDRIAQIAIVPIEQAKFLEVGYIKDTSRGENGFGSTGI